MMPRGRFISFLKARKFIAKGCLYHLIQVKDIEAKKQAPTLESVPVVNEYSEVVNEYSDVFPDELTRLPPAREIDFAIDIDPGTQPILIPPYRMMPAKLKDLKE